MELAPCPAIGETGCQGFIGPFPSAFLDKRFKELVQIYGRSFELTKYIL
jgi:hypothetical protein